MNKDRYMGEVYDPNEVTHWYEKDRLALIAERDALRDERDLFLAERKVPNQQPYQAPDGFEYGDELPSEAVVYLLNEKLWRGDVSRESLHALVMSHIRIVKERDRYQEALKWYADWRNYQGPMGGMAGSGMYKDTGYLAREALSAPTNGKI